ncbi:MAG: LysR family transcriptional regulator [Caulobacter sp.]|nr:LysR family transcriptional regulator [Caulobacter sp.]
MQYYTAMTDWDDLRVFLATARGGSFADAAQRLRMDATTVARRIQRLESGLTARLFVRSPRGLQLTATGAELMEASLAIEGAVDRVGAIEALAGATGVVRVSASEGFGAHVLAPAAPALLADRPGLSLELVANAGFLSASSREVDLAVTFAPPQNSRLVVERLTDYALGLYAAPGYLAKAGRPDTLEALRPHELVGYIDDLIYAPELRYLNDVLPGLRARTTSSSIRAQLELTRAGAGLCVLPHFMAAADPGLEPVLGDKVRLVRSFWMSVHRDLQDARRLRAVQAWLVETVAARQSSLMPA